MAVASAAGGTYPGETNWGAFDQNYAVTDDTPAAANNGAAQTTIVAWEQNSDLWIEGRNADNSRTTLVQRFPGGMAATTQAPSATFLRYDFAVVWRGMDNRIWYSVNPDGAIATLATNWTQPRAITNPNGGFVTTSATPTITETGGRVTVAYRGASNSNSNIWTIDGTLGSSNLVLNWSNNAQTGFSSPSSPSITNFAGTQVPTPLRSRSRPVLTAAGNQMMITSLTHGSAYTDGSIMTRARYSGDVGAWGNWNNDPQQWHSFSAPVLYAISTAIYILIRGGTNGVIYGKEVSRN
ncbi:hypothetical protein ABZ883_03870 [Streptomyces sp. NPDC046977]|uniref:hypothetical protein n=1 Tax=Streptomyces sp. NPDC046977 TaxID=3154703 RepID=UPI0033CA37A6